MCEILIRSSRKFPSFERESETVIILCNDMVSKSVTDEICFEDIEACMGIDQFKKETK